MNVLTSIDQATPAWMTDILHRAGVLEAGAVVAVQVHANSAFNSVAAHFALQYSQDAPPTAPDRVFFKLNQHHEGKHEIAFYRMVSQLSDREQLPMIVPCYDAVYDAATGASHCLLRDVWQTHLPVLTREQVLSGHSVPEEDHLLQVIEAVAQFHAFWWEHPQLREGAIALPFPFVSRERYLQKVQRLVHEWGQFLPTVHDWFPNELRDLYEHALTRVPKLWDGFFRDRFMHRRAITLITSDCYFNQFLCPKAGRKDRMYRIDFQDICANLGTEDLVFLFASFWSSEQRRFNHREERLLRHYHACLQTHGVTDYSWDDLIRDYRLKLIWRVFLPVWDQINGSPRDYWWPKLQCRTMAYQDWNCREFLSAL